MVVKRGDVWRVSPGPVVGRNARKIRPVVVVSPPELHGHLRTVIVAPMTTVGSSAPFRIALRFDGARGLILLDQLRTMNKSRLLARLGAVSPATQRAMLAALQQTFAP
jgi:mRNA interferase MazF